MVSAGVRGHTASLQRLMGHTPSEQRMNLREARARTQSIVGLARAMGVAPPRAKPIADELVRLFAKADGSRAMLSRPDAPSNVVRDIEWVGHRLTAGAATAMAYPVGSWAIAFATMPLESGYFVNAPSWIGMMTDGDRGQEFANYVNRTATHWSGSI